MQREYKAYHGQSIYDVCLQTYGDLKYLFTKLIPDNGFISLNMTDLGGRSFIFDTDFIKDNSVYNRNTNENIIYVTGFKVDQTGDNSFDNSFDISFN